MLVVLMSIHIIGAIITIIIHCRDGTMEHASKYGGGFRFAKPSDVIFQDCLLMGNSISNSYDNLYRRLHKQSIQ